MQTIAIIPARMGSTRFFGKPMKKILGVPMVERVYRNAIKSKKVDEVYVATCDKEIYLHILSIGGNAVYTKKTHERCTERTAEALIKIEQKLKVKFKTVLMIQGDEPMIEPSMINSALKPFEKYKNVNVVNLMTKIKDRKEFIDPNEPKVVVDKFNHALYFSRCPIPSPWISFSNNVFKQVCVIPFKRDFLIKFLKMKTSYLEKTESIDMNRVLENGYKVHMVEIKRYVKSVDTMTDLKQVEKLLRLNS